MKKFFLILLFTGILTNSLNSMIQEKPKTTELAIDTKISDQLTLLSTQMKKLETLVSQTNEPKNSSKIEKVNSKISALKEKVKSLFNFVATNIDNMLTQKGAISTLLILGPLFTAYCVFFNPEPVKKIIAYISAWYTKGAVGVGASIGSGVVNGAIEGVKDNWWELLKIGGITTAVLTTLSVPGTFIMECTKQAAPIITKLLFLKMHLISSQSPTTAEKN